MERTLLCASLSLVAACSAATSAFDYHVDDTAFPRDFNYTFTDMGAHAGMPMDLAVVDATGFVQSHVRMYLPPKPDKGSYPDVSVALKNALWAGTHRMYFYIDENENYLLDTEDDARKKAKEHTWIEPVADTGTGSFKHSTKFQIFATTDLQTIGANVVIRMPALPDSTAANAACLLEVLRSKFKDQVEVRILRFESDGELRQMGMFRTYPGVPLPREVRLEGIVDKGSHYSVEIARDGEQSILDVPEADGEIVVKAEDWAGVSAADILRCR
jgi:hypothetical protein